MESSAPPPERILPRAILVLSAFAPDGSSLRFSDIVDRTGLPKATAHRILAEMTELRLVERDTDRRFHLGRRLFELGMLASVERNLIEVSTPFLQELYEQSHETVHLGIRDGDDVVYIAKIGGHRQARMPSRLGGRMPLHCTAIGKVLLAFDDQRSTMEFLKKPLESRTRRSITTPGRLLQQLKEALIDGVATEYEESAVGVNCLAAPVLDSDDCPIAAISIAGQAARFKPENYVTAIRAAASGIASTSARRAALMRKDGR